MIVQMWMAQGAPWLKDKVDSSGQKYYIVIDWNMQMKSVGPPMAMYRYNNIMCKRNTIMYDVNHH